MARAAVLVFLNCFVSAGSGKAAALHGYSYRGYRSLIAPDNDPQARKYFQQPMCGGIGILDYDGDGLVDIFFSNGAKLPD